MDAVQTEMVEQHDHRVDPKFQKGPDTLWRVGGVRRVTEADDVGRDAMKVVGQRHDRALPVRHRGGAWARAVQ